MKIELILVTTYLCIGSFVAGREYENDNPREGWPLKIARAFGRIFAYPIMWVLYKILSLIYIHILCRFFLLNHWVDLWSKEYDNGSKEALTKMYELSLIEFPKMNWLMRFFANRIQKAIFKRNDFTPKE